MKTKHLKLIMELIFIFIIPLVILCINCNYQNSIEYDNNGNYQATEKHIEFTTPFTYIDGYKNVINNFNLWDEIWEIGNISDTTGDNFYWPHSIRSINYIAVEPQIAYYFKSPIYLYLRYYDSSYNYIGYNVALNNVITIPNNVYYLRFVTDVTSYNNNICINKSVSWANGNYVPYGDPLILYTQTDVSGQNDINYTIWGKLKNLIVDYLQIQDNQIVDIIITYTILWFIMFVIWHFFYLFFDGLVHLFIDWKKRSD